MNIRISTDKNNRKTAYKVTNDCRNIRMSLKEAELMIATGSALSITYGPNPFEYGVGYIGSETVNGTTISYTAYTA